MKPVNVYQLKNGQFVKTDATLAVGSEWLVGAQVTTQDEKTFYQISTNSYVLQDDNVSVVKMQNKKRHFEVSFFIYQIL
nr:SLAP domain-containing protein [Lactobacillus terrae]